jgi:NAD-dependent dihydropyrimidine dehydrogenase PreA subunit
MCEFCHKHGEGKKWYLQAKHYSEDLLSDARRRRFAQEFFRTPTKLAEVPAQLMRLRHLPPFVRRMAKARASKQAKRYHFGQVVPIEEIGQIFGFVNSIARTACICRHATLGEKARYCYSVSLGKRGLGSVLDDVDTSFATGPDLSQLESLTPEEAMQAFREHERDGLCHTVWTFVTPFIGGICNCDRADCLAMRATVVHDVQVMFRAEYVAEVDPDLCTGCRSCMRRCQFGALGYSATRGKTLVDQFACYGCGVCRSACTKEAIRLVPRADVPAVAQLF